MLDGLTGKELLYISSMWTLELH